jgi:multidrug efflux pump subunit AcrB
LIGAVATLSASRTLGFVAILDMLTPINIVIRNAILVVLIDHPISEGRGRWRSVLGTDGTRDDGVASSSMRR